MGMMLVSIFFLFIAAVIILGILLIIIGTILYHKTSHKRLGVALRIFGYIFLIPSLAVGGLPRNVQQT